MVVPRGIQGVEAGEKVPVQLYSKKSDIERTIFCIGSHDMTLDLLAQFLASHDRRLTSANVGSQGGLVALQRGEAHLAGSHLLDPETGEYNVAYLPKYPGRNPGYAGGVGTAGTRFYGFEGNPKNIKDLGDLSNPGTRFVNRQRGAGHAFCLITT